MKYNREKLIQENQVWTKVDFVFFWKPSMSDKIDNGCLSQWYMSDFIIEGNTYCCAEQYMMAEKALLFGDNEIFREIVREKSPKRIRQLGRLVKNFDPSIWDQHKTDYVRKANHAKFTQHSKLHDFLCSTKDKILVEASPYDRIWGIGMAESNAKCLNPSLWTGLNLLGFTLMEVRDEILSHQKIML